MRCGWDLDGGSDIVFIILASGGIISKAMEDLWGISYIVYGRDYFSVINRVIRCCVSGPLSGIVLHDVCTYTILLNSFDILQSTPEVYSRVVGMIYRREYNALGQKYVCAFRGLVKISIPIVCRVRGNCRNKHRATSINFVNIFNRVYAFTYT